MTYDAQHRFARCLFRIAREGLSASEHFKSAERCCLEWETLRKYCKDVSRLLTRLIAVFIGMFVANVEACHYYTCRKRSC